jgi:hypothetical protein
MKVWPAFVAGAAGLGIGGYYAYAERNEMVPDAWILWVSSGLLVFTCAWVALASYRGRQKISGVLNGWIATDAISAAIGAGFVVALLVVVGTHRYLEGHAQSGLSAPAAVTATPASSSAAEQANQPPQATNAIPASAQVDYEARMESLLLTISIRASNKDPRDRSDLRFQDQTVGGPVDFIYYAGNEDPEGLITLESNVALPDGCLERLTPVSGRNRSLDALQRLRDEIRVTIVSTGTVAHILTPGEQIMLTLTKRLDLTSDVSTAWIRLQIDDLDRARDAADALATMRCREVLSNPQ